MSKTTNDLPDSHGGLAPTEWAEHGSATRERDRDLLEQSYLRIIRSEKEPRPEHIECVHLHDKSLRIAPEDELDFRSQLFELLEFENAKPRPAPLDPKSSIPSGYWDNERNWDRPSGAPVDNFAAYPMLAKYLKSLWIHPRKGIMECLPGEPWVVFGMRGGWSPAGR